MFIDRDGEAFRYTLHYLRTGDTDICSNDQLKMLRSEAKFYELGMLEVKIDKILADLEERNDQLGALEKKMDELLAETEARYYQSDALGKKIAEILTEKKSAKKVYRLVEKDELDNLSSLNPEVTAQATSLSSMKKNFELITTINYIYQVYKCPRGIPVHDAPTNVVENATKYLNPIILARFMNPLESISSYDGN